MQRSTIELLLLLLGIFAMHSDGHAKPLSIDTDMNWPVLPNLHLPKPIVPRVVAEHFSLGHKVAGAFPLKTYESVLTFEQLQNEFTVNIAYPKQDDIQAIKDDNSAVVTQVEVFLEGTDGFRSQVYVTGGGIEQHNISMDIVANNVDMLHYLVFIYGIKDY